MRRRNRLIVGGACLAVVLVPAALFSVRGAARAGEREDIVGSLQKLQKEYELGRDPKAVKDTLLLLRRRADGLSGTDESARLVREEIREALNQVQCAIAARRPPDLNDRLTLSSYLKRYARDVQPVYSFRKLSSRDAVSRNRQLLRGEVERLMGGFPKKSPLNPVVVEKTDYRDHVREKIVFESEPGRSVVGYLLIPKNGKFPLPAVVCFHQHGKEYFAGKDGPVGEHGQPSELSYALDLTRRGYVTLSVDAPCFGERCEDEGDVGYLAGLVGRPLIGFVIYDDLRSIDYLATRSEVDRDNIGCIGHSLGGTRAMYVAALDDRIKASVSLNAYSNIRDLIASDRHRWPATTYLPGLLPFAEIEDLVCMSAPRPALVAVSELDDSLALDNLEQGFANIRRVYSMYGPEGSFKPLVFKNTVHGFPGEYHEEIYRWFDRHLK